MKKKILFIILFSILFFRNDTFAKWLFVESENGIMWLNDDNTYPKDTWYIIDDDGDGIGYYYNFDDMGRVLIDTITDDYRIVDNMGRRTLLDGSPEAVNMNSNEAKNMTDDERAALDFYAAAQKGEAGTITGFTSQGSISNVLDSAMPTVAGANTNDGNVIIGKNVVIKETEAFYDPTIDRHCVEYIKGGNNYSKKVNGTTFTKVKWKEVIALKGTGASIEIENPKNNFNRIRGKIATHYFTYTDRTTMCTLTVFDEAGTEYFSTTNFNYNAGANIDFTFPKRTKKLKFELTVDGQYSSRVAYIKDLSFYFNKAAYEEEMEEDEWESLRRENGYNEIVEEEIVYEDEEEYDSEESEDEDREETTKSSNDSSQGPSFDKALTATSSNAIAPDGSSPIWKKK